MPTLGETYNPWRLFVGCIVPNDIARSTELSPTAKITFGRLCQFAGANGQAYPSYSTLAKEVGVKPRQAMRAVKELEAFGLIRPIKQNRPDGGSSSNAYEFLWHSIFSVATCSHKGAKDGRGGRVINATPAQCHPRHGEVSEMPPKESETRDRMDEETRTANEARLLLSGTPFSAISDKELMVLIKRHGSERLINTSDIAAEGWRRDKKDIRNPGGYLQTLCGSHIVPEWYEPPEVRHCKVTAAAEKKRAETKKMEEHLASEARESQERENYWLSISEEDRQRHRSEAKAASALFEKLDGIRLDAIAKLMVWEQTFNS